MTTLINILILLFVPFLAMGVIKKTKAFWAGRKGAPLLQPLYDFLRLMKKETVYSTTTSWVFKLAPVINFAAIIFASLFVPLIKGYAILNIPFAFIVFSYILGLGKFFSLIAALDTGSSFEGMGASREACFSTIVEPAFFIVMASVVALTKITSFENLKYILYNSGIYGILIVVLAVLALFIMLLVEGCRVPVDDPNTHLELTMIHEVMILDNSGFDLGLIVWGSTIKMFLLEALIASLIIPSNIPFIAYITAFLAIIFLISVIIGTIESSIARFRMTHVFEFIFIMSIMALLILTLTTYRIYGI
ncbi:MAG: NADH-quinone oxidoreductase subunit H [Candidatus Gastranaerophilales bacterium]|nr:NADH-quinone oxidoreductase subunit H [Candidatus Gastranaerophilales bacterium]